MKKGKKKKDRQPVWEHWERSDWGFGWGIQLLSSLWSRLNPPGQNKSNQIKSKISRYNNHNNKRLKFEKRGKDKKCEIEWIV